MEEEEEEREDEELPADEERGDTGEDEVLLCEDADGAEEERVERSPARRGATCSTCNADGRSPPREKKSNKKGTTQWCPTPLPFVACLQRPRRASWLKLAGEENCSQMSFCPNPLDCDPIPPAIVQHFQSAIVLDLSSFACICWQRSYFVRAWHLLVENHRRLR